MQIWNNFSPGTFGEESVSDFERIKEETLV